jgi:hypothetical protein
MSSRFRRKSGCSLQRVKKCLPMLLNGFCNSLDDSYGQVNAGCENRAKIFEIGVEGRYEEYEEEGRVRC